MDEQETPGIENEQPVQQTPEEQAKQDTTGEQEDPVSAEDQIAQATSQHTATRRNIWHIILIIIALIPLNYAIYVTLKPAGTGIPNSTDRIGDLISAAKNNPSAETFLSLGMAYYDAHRFNEAINAWKVAVEYNPNNEIVYNDLGVGYGGLGKWEEMKQYCLKALAINPNFALAKNNLAWASDELAKLDTDAGKRKEPVKAVPEAGGADFNALLTQGLNYYNQKQFPEAIEAWKKALLLNPNSEMAYSNIGAAYGCMEKWDEQVQYCKKALSINPDFQLAKNNLAWGLSELKKRGQKR